MKRFTILLSVLFVALYSLAQDDTFDLNEVVAEFNGKLFYFYGTKVDMEPNVETFTPSFPQEATLIRHSYRKEIWNEESMDYDMVTAYIDYNLSGAWVFPAYFIADNYCSLPFNQFWLTHINGDVFNNCPNLTSITLPSSIDYLDAYTFSDAPNLTEIHCQWDEPKSVSKIFGNNESQYETCTLYVPSGKVDVYKNTEGWNKFQVIKVDPAECMKGDVDASSIVDVDDVNAMINLILSYDQYKDKYPGEADLDGSGIVDVDDVNALINIILNKD